MARPTRTRPAGPYPGGPQRSRVHTDRAGARAGGGESVLQGDSLRVGGWKVLDPGGWLQDGVSELPAAETYTSKWRWGGRGRAATWGHCWPAGPGALNPPLLAWGPLGACPLWSGADPMGPQLLVHGALRLLAHSWGRGRVAALGRSPPDLALGAASLCIRRASASSDLSMPGPAPQAARPRSECRSGRKARDPKLWPPQGRPHRGDLGQSRGASVLVLRHGAGPGGRRGRTVGT